MIQPATIRDIHRICHEWDHRPEPVDSRPKPMLWLPSWAALLAASVGLAGMHFGPKVPLTGWSYVLLLWGIVGIEAVVLIYLLISLAYDAKQFWKDLRSSSEAFPPDEDRDLEKQMEFLRQLAAHSDPDLLFVARTLETKSRRIENRRTAIFGISSLIAAVVVFLVTHSSVIKPIVPGYSWIPKLLPILQIGFIFVAGGTVVAFLLAVGSVWLHSSASANRALLLRRVVEDRTSLT